MIAFRPITADDRRFVISAWSSSYKHSHTAGMIMADQWADVMHRQIDALLSRPTTRAIVAYEHRDPAFVYGFAAGDVEGDPVLHYVYVKEPYRRMGHARALVVELGIDPARRFLYTCKTAIVPRLAGSIPSARFDPNPARYPRQA